MQGKLGKSYFGWGYCVLDWDLEGEPPSFLWWWLRIRLVWDKNPKMHTFPQVVPKYL
tara:strand:+ start:623 stop:793 length:171 start_codon:yes stop_codon:yes gene_type:complete